MRAHKSDGKGTRLKRPLLNEYITLKDKVRIRQRNTENAEAGSLCTYN